MQTNEGPQQGGDRKQEAGALAIVLVAVFYVILLGPAARLHESSPSGVQTVIERIYSPLEWLDERIPGCPFSWYIEVWQR